MTNPSPWAVGGGSRRKHRRTRAECDRYALGIDCSTLDQIMDSFKPIQEER